MENKIWNKEEVNRLAPVSCIIGNSGMVYQESSELVRTSGKKVIVLNFDEPDLGEGFNPIGYIYQLYLGGNTNKTIQLLQKMGHMIFKAEASESADPFWENTATDFFTGISLLLMKEGKDNEIHFGSIRKLIEEAVTTNKIEQYLNTISTMDPIALFLSPTLHAQIDTKKSILSVLQGNLNYFVANPSQNEMLSETTFELTDKDVCYFIIGSKDNKLSNIFIEQLNVICGKELVVYEKEDGSEVSGIDYPKRKKQNVSYIELEIKE